jgi:hypothetical protein
MFQFDAQDDPSLPSFPTLPDDAADEDLTALPTMEESAPAAGAGAAARPMRRRGWALPSMSRSPATHRTKPARFPPQRQRLPRWRGAFSLRVGRSGAHHSGSTTGRRRDVRWRYS